MPAVTRTNRLPVRSYLLSCCLLAVLAALGAAAPAGAATRSATSPVTGFDATLTGTQLTVTTGQRSSRAFLNTVRGRTVTVACATGGEQLVKVVDEQTFLPTSNFDVAVLGGPAAWAAGSDSLTFTLARDVSETVDGCVVVRDRAAASTFAFNELARGVLRETIAEQRLLLAHVAAKQIARARADRRLPHARALAGTIAASEPQLKVDFAKSLRRARRNDVVYVIGAGTTRTRVLLAYRQNDGQPVRLEGRRRGEGEIISPEGRGNFVPVPEDAPVGRRPAGR